MSESQPVSDWWANALLRRSHGPHPVYGQAFSVRAGEDIVELMGTVDNREEVEKIEREAQKFAGERVVVNHLSVGAALETAHMQTIVGVFSNEDLARLAVREAEAGRWRTDARPEIVTPDKRRDRKLKRLGSPAGLNEKDLTRLKDWLEAGKTLLVDRVPEDDAFGVVSALEGSGADIVTTLPPEPDATG